MKETYKTNPALVDHIKGLQAYQKIKQEREEDLKRDREIMFEAAFPALIAGTVIGLIMGELLLRIWALNKQTESQEWYKEVSV